MPIFEFHCTACGHCFERITRVPADDSTCPACGAPARRSVSVPVVGGAAAAPGGAGGGCAPRGGFS